MSDNDQDRISKNSLRCSPVKQLEFRGAIPVHVKNRFGDDLTCIDLLFNEGIDIRLFSPAKSIRDRGIQSKQLTSLCDSLGTDFKDIPPCRGGWEEFVGELTSLLRPFKFKLIFTKLTVNEKGWITLGEGRCFSSKPDMEYTDEDLRFLEYVDDKVPEVRREEIREVLLSSGEIPYNPIIKRKDNPRGFSSGLEWESLTWEIEDKPDALVQELFGVQPPQEKSKRFMDEGTPEYEATEPDWLDLAISAQQEHSEAEAVQTTTKEEKAPTEAKKPKRRKKEEIVLPDLLEGEVEFGDIEDLPK